MVGCGDLVRDADDGLLQRVRLVEGLYRVPKKKQKRHGVETSITIKSELGQLNLNFQNKI